MKLKNVRAAAAALMLLTMLLSARPACAFTLSDRVHDFTLINGLRVLVMERHTSPTVSFSMSFKTGSVDEQCGASGIAHLLEHMMFKGTETIGTTGYGEEKKVLARIDTAAQQLDDEKKKGAAADQEKLKRLTENLRSLQKQLGTFIKENELDAIYEQNGAEGLNASTSYDLTTYTVSLPSNRLELWARIESERFARPVFRQFYSERDVVLEELRQSYETKPDRMLMTQFLAAAFIASPYGRPIYGWKSDVEFLSRKTCEDFFKAHYSLNNAVVAIVGDVQVEAVRAVLDRYFGCLPVRPLTASPVSAEPEQMGERRIQVVFDAEPAFIMGYHKPTVPEFDDYVFDVIDGLLSGGRTSRLYKTLVLEKKNALSVMTHNGMPGTRFPNLFIIKVLPAENVSCEKIEKDVCRELASLKHKAVPGEELRKIKKQLKTDFIRQLQSNAELAGILSYYQTVCGDWRYLEKHLAVIDTITAEDVQRVARTYLIDKNKTVACLVKDTGK